MLAKIRKIYSLELNDLVDVAAFLFVVRNFKNDMISLHLSMWIHLTLCTVVRFVNSRFEMPEIETITYVIQKFVNSAFAFDCNNYTKKFVSEKSVGNWFFHVTKWKDRILLHVKVNTLACSDILLAKWCWHFSITRAIIRSFQRNIIKSCRYSILSQIMSRKLINQHTETSFRFSVSSESIFSHMWNGTHQMP